MTQTPAEQIRAVIAAVAADHSLTYADMIGPSKTREHVAVRSAAIREVRKRWPSMTWRRLGEHFHRNECTVREAFGLRKRTKGMGK